MTPAALRLVNTQTGEIVEDIQLDNALRRVEELEADVANLEKDLRAKRALITRLNRDRERERRAYEDRQVVESIFGEWQRECSHPHSKLTAERFDAIRGMLEKGYKREQFSLAIAGAKFDPFCTKRKNGTVQRHDDIELICREGVKFESFANRAPKR
jgi:hypothetical protein